MRCFVVGSDGGDGQDVAALATDALGVPPVVVPDLPALEADPGFASGDRALVLLPTPPGRDPDIEAAVTLARDGGGRVFAVCLAETIPPDGYKRLVRTGGADWVAWPGHASELRDIVARLEPAEVRGDRGAAARIVGFFPSKGGVGNTALAVEAAFRLLGPAGARGRRDRARRVAILDLNLQGGTAADALDVRPHLDLGEVMRRPERLDEHLVEVFRSRHESGLDVFAAPNSRLRPDEVRPEIVFTIIDAVAARYDAVLLDLPPVWHGWTENLLRGSDAVVVTGSETVPALRRLKAALDGLDGCGVPADAIGVVVNGVGTDLLGRPARRVPIERALAGRRSFLVRRDEEAVREALDAGRPVSEVAGGGRFARDLKPVVAWLEGIVAGSVAAGRAAA